MQIAPELYYSGNGILSSMLRFIKIYTIKVLQQTTEDEEEEDQAKYDVFLTFVYTPENGGFRDLQQQTSIEVLSNTYRKLSEVS